MFQNEIRPAARRHRCDRAPAESCGRDSSSHGESTQGKGWRNNANGRGVRWCRAKLTAARGGAEPCHHARKGSIFRAQAALMRQQAENAAMKHAQQVAAWERERGRPHEAGSLPCERRTEEELGRVSEEGNCWTEKEKALPAQ